MKVTLNLNEMFNPLLTFVIIYYKYYLDNVYIISTIIYTYVYESNRLIIINMLNITKTTFRTENKNYPTHRYTYYTYTCVYKMFYKT